MVSDPLGLPLTGLLGDQGGGASGLCPSPFLVPPPPWCHLPEPWPLSPQALPAAGASALHGHCGDGAVLALRGVITPKPNPHTAIRDLDLLCDHV